MLRSCIALKLHLTYRVSTLNAQQQSVRWNWQGHSPRIFDKTTGKWKRDIDAWDALMAVPSEPMKGTTSLVDMYMYNTEHVKPTEEKRQKADRVRYERQHKRIDDLTKYIKFMKEHPDEFGRGKRR